MFDDNRRKYPRVNYPCQITMWLEDGSNQTIIATTTNIGAGGLCVQLNESMTIGVKTDIRLTFSNTTTPFKCRGTVVRCKRKSENLYEIGIQFAALDELKSAFINGQVSDLLDEEKKGKK